MSNIKTYELCNKLIQNVPLIKFGKNETKYVVALTQVAFIVNPFTNRTDYVESPEIKIPNDFSTPGTRTIKTEQAVEFLKPWLEAQPHFNAHIPLNRDWVEFSRQKYNPIVVNPRGFGFGLNVTTLPFRRSAGETPAFMVDAEVFTKLFNYYVSHDSPYKNASINFGIAFPKVVDGLAAGPILFFNRYSELIFGIMPLNRVLTN